MRLFVLLGYPGTGKGIIAQYLKQAKDFQHLSLGEYLRTNVAENTTIGEKYRDKILSGLSLIECGVVNNVVKEKISLALSMNKNFILDGFPRTENQLNVFNTFCQEIAVVPIFIYLVASKNICVERLLTRETCSKCGYDYIMQSPIKPLICDYCSGRLRRRATDNTDTIEQRISFFKQTTGKVANLLLEEGKLLKLNTNCKVSELIPRFLKFLHVQNIGV